MPHDKEKTSVPIFWDGRIPRCHPACTARPYRSRALYGARPPRLLAARSRAEYPLRAAVSHRPTALLRHGKGMLPFIAIEKYYSILSIKKQGRRCLSPFPRKNLKKACSDLRKGFHILVVKNEKKHNIWRKTRTFIKIGRNFVRIFKKDRKKCKNFKKRC